MLCGLLLLSVLPLHAQSVMEISYKDATPATTLPLADIGKMWFADNQLQASSVSSPAKITKAALAGISSIKFKNSQTDIKRLNAVDADQCCIYDLQGRVVARGQWSMLNSQWSLPHGIYIIKGNNKTIRISK